MYGLIVTLYAKTASFRDPGAQLYHETMPLPPPSTITGIAGAALGLSFEDALAFMKENAVMVGCNGSSEGRGKDLWNYTKIKSGEITNAIIIRNFLADLKVEIFFACEKREVITRLADAFENPVYAITLGNSDEIAKICSIEIFEEISCEKKKILTNTWLPGDYSRKLKVDWEKVKKAKISLTLKPPIVKKLPCDFEFDANGVRKAVKYLDITFMGDNHILETEAEVLVFGNKFAAVMKHEG
ncbi:CRISPR-associated protein Cas5 [Acetivibrio thermocellus]|uniref:CRISPR-associated protein Cas5 n=1 Tax=Acetivibrio thermocellus TaxID=1515 RepID=UPI00017E27C4|nr:CRISPR-associated protein Cas5 [Acetivibrio thermocellus]CDG36820.1 CRISPR-associated protein Cas5 [Acetivibrio thermocellus BC1]NLU27710.1 CRISPR-associated protein Cas5 [Acetivibrio thermocellus]THJ77524.1 CRISPR-associated protein Cas5 [Acetivibrio thermocellus]UWV46880.1 CRISPR-associated protein Cas5 [Acetivibrio thermocellus]HOP93386.1 CRISPR-associated protein Cas5 [Acetivibrio thermocellus]